MNDKILVMTAVAAERDAVLRGLSGGNPRFDVRLAGVGPVAAAINTTAALLRSGGAYRLVVSAGIAGGFAGRADIGDIVVATAMIAADLGAETPEGFRGVDELGFGETRVDADEATVDRIAEALAAGGRLRVVRGPIVTVSTATGTAATETRHAARIPGVAAEGMEGYGIAAAAQACGVPALEIRAISNRVGPRDRDAWRIGDALASLELAFAQLSEGLSS